jgi:hypothetical protein
MTGAERNKANRDSPTARKGFLRKKLLYLLVAAVFVTILASRLPAVNQPFGRDQGIFACVGQNILKGSVPYRDLWDQKPPGIHFTYALLMWLFGDSMRVMQVADLLAFMLAAYLVYSVLKEIRGVRAGVLALLVYFFYSDPLFYGYGNGYWARSQSETYMVPFLVAGLWAFVRFLRLRSGWLAWLAGFLWGAAFLFKYTAIFYPLCALAFMGLCSSSVEGRLSRRTLRSLGRTSIMVGCGFGASLAPFIVYFAAHRALEDLIDVTVLYNLKYASAVGVGKWGLSRAFGQVVKWTMRNPFLWLTGMAGVVAFAGRIRRKEMGGILLLWLAASWAAIAVNRRYFHYYFIQIVPPLAMLSGSMLDLCIGWMRKRRLWILILPALAACIVFLVADVQKVRRNLKPDLDFALGKTSRPEYWSRFVTGDFSFLADLYLAEYLEERTDQEDAIFIFGFEPLVYFLAERRPAGRYIYNDPVTVGHGGPDEAAVGIEQMVTDLESSKPAYVVIVEGDTNPVDRTDSYVFFMNTPSLRDFVETEYTLDRQARKFHIYRRKPENGAR